MAFDYDVIIIGSGFGGAITACRLAEANLKVLVLERGRRWAKETYPRKPTDSWFWNNAAPERENGWIDLRLFPSMAVAQGAAVGGGSLIYASISVEAPPKAFDQDWPAEITHQELEPYYEAVVRFMSIQTIPKPQWTPRTKLMREAAEKAGYGDRFKPIGMAVTFDPNLTLDPATPPQIGDSKTFTNAQGVSQGTCVHLGNCDIGCDVYAKNTLDKNYIPWAESTSCQKSATCISRPTSNPKGPAIGSRTTESFPTGGSRAKSRGKRSSWPRGRSGRATCS